MILESVEHVSRYRRSMWVINCIGSCGYQFIPPFIFLPLTHLHPLLAVIFLPGVSIHFTLICVLITISMFFSSLWKVYDVISISLIHPSWLTLICSKLLCFSVNGIFFFFCIFIMSGSYFTVSLSHLFLLSSAPNDSLYSHLLDMVNAAAVHACGCGGLGVCFPWFADFSNIIGVELPYENHLSFWFQSPLIVMPKEAPTTYLPPVSFKIPPLLIIALLFLVCGETFMVSEYHCSLPFPITENRVNEAHFQRLLSKHWLCLPVDLSFLVVWFVLVFIWVCHPKPVYRGSCRLKPSHFVNSQVSS